MNSIEITGKTVEEAIQKGLTQMGLERLDVTVEVLDEGSKGFLGIFRAREAKVRLTEREKEEEFDVEAILHGPARTEKKPAPKPQPAPEKKPEAPKAPAAPAVKPEPKSEPKPESKPAPVKKQDIGKPQSTPKPQPAKAEEKPEAKPQNVKQAAQEKQPRPPKQPKPQQPKTEQNAEKAAEQPKQSRQPKPVHLHEEGSCPEIPEGPLPEQKYEELSDLGKKAFDYLKKLTSLMGVDVRMYIAENENGMSISMEGDTLGILIGRRGDTLDALQYLTSLELNKNRSEYYRVSLDTEHYRAKREESLVRLAERMAARCVKSGRRVVLEPMNPYERRILHSALQNNEQVQTHSEGEEPNRRVVITLKQEAAAERPQGPRPKPIKPHIKNGESPKSIEAKTPEQPKEPKPRPKRPPRPRNNGGEGRKNNEGKAPETRTPEVKAETNE